MITTIFPSQLPPAPKRPRDDPIPTPASKPRADPKPSTPTSATKKEDPRPPSRPTSPVRRVAGEVSPPPFYVKDHPANYMERKLSSSVCPQFGFCGLNWVLSFVLILLAFFGTGHSRLFFVWKLADLGYSPIRPPEKKSKGVDGPNPPLRGEA